MRDLKVLIAAAGRGTRAGLPYPKTLHPVQGQPILLRLLDVLNPYDPAPTVVVSPQGKDPVEACLLEQGRRAHLVVQPHPNGMGDAVMRFVDSPAFPAAGHVLLAWGDLPLLQASTVGTVVARHLADSNDLTFATRDVEAAYTVVTRDADGKVLDLVETREAGGSQPRPGERDIGLFVFRRDVVLDALREEVPARYGTSTGEHGFLYVVGLLAAKGFKIAAIPCATELDLVSLNSLEDLKGHA